MLHSYRSVRVVSWRPYLQVYARRWSQFRELSPFRRLSNNKLTGSLWCINYLCFFNHNPRPVILCMIWLWDKLLWPPSRLPQLIFILLDIFVTNDLRKGVSFQKKMFFQNGYDEGLSPLSPFEWDDQGLPGLGEGLRWWLNWFRCGHEGLSLSPKDRFVITPYLYSYQVQPLETVWAVAQSELVWFEPQCYDGWGAPGG
jgi:hypothetical protein